MPDFDKVIRFLFYVLIGWLPFGSSAVEVAVLLAMFFWLIKRIGCLMQEPKKSLRVVVRSFRPHKTFLDWPIVCFLFLSLLSLFSSAYLSDSLWGFLTKTLEWFIVYYLVVEVFDRQEYVQKIILILLFSALIVAVDSLVQFYWLGKDLFLERSLVVGRATGPFKHPNTLAAYWTIIIPFVFYFIFLQRKFVINQMFFSGVLIVFLWSFFLTFCRMGWCSVVVSILVFSLFYSFKKVSIIFLTGLIAFSILLFLPPSVKKDLRLNKLQIQTAVQWRTGLWEDSLKMVKDRPVFGFGINTYMKEMRDYRRESYHKNKHLMSYAHNCFLQMAVEIGIFGFISFISIFGLFYVGVLKRVLTKPIICCENFKYACLIGLCLGLGAFLMHSFFDTHFYSLQLSVFFWVIFGLAVALLNMLNIKMVRVA